CPSSRAVSVSGLEPGATLTFELRTATGRETLGKIGVPEDVTSYTFWLPDLSNRIPAVLIARQELCGHAAESDPINLKPVDPPLKPTIVGDVVECANWVLLMQTQGAVVRLFSNAPKSGFLSPPTYMTSDWIQPFGRCGAGRSSTPRFLLGAMPQTKGDQTT